MKTDCNIVDISGNASFNLNFLAIKKRIDKLIESYLYAEKLRDCLENLPQQFTNPRPRSWHPINWQNINCKQIIDMDIEVFLAIIIGTINTEAPIRGYTQTSRQYLEEIHPEMARFVGVIFAEYGTMLELGLWEKEERQHAPALSKIYQQLTVKKLISNPHKSKNYQPSNHS